jgi:hypothetical protein
MKKLKDDDMNRFYSIKYMSNPWRWDVFICHASEDKVEVAKPLAQRLTKEGVKVWYDDFELTLGDGLRQKIDQGLSLSKYGIVVLSPNFFQKRWPQYELNGLVSRELDTEKVILPIWHKISYSEIRRFSPPLADKISVSTKDGIESIVDKIVQLVKPTKPEDKFAQLRNQIKEIEQIAEANRPTPRLEDAEIADNLVELMNQCKYLGQEIFDSVLRPRDLVLLTKWLAELQEKIDWYIDLNG